METNYRKSIFTSKSELINELIERDADNEFIQFVEDCNTLDEVFDNCPMDYRIYAIARGFNQFVRNMDFSKLNNDDWAYIIKFRPEYIAHVNTNIFNGRNWADILSRQPQLFEYCAQWKLDNDDWCNILMFQPELGERFYNYSIFNGKNWARLLSSKERAEKFAKFCNWSKLSEEDMAYLLRWNPEIKNM